MLCRVNSNAGTAWSSRATSGAGLTNDDSSLWYKAKPCLSSYRLRGRKMTRHRAWRMWLSGRQRSSTWRQSRLSIRSQTTSAKSISRTIALSRASMRQTYRRKRRRIMTRKIPILARTSQAISRSLCKPRPRKTWHTWTKFSRQTKGPHLIATRLTPPRFARSVDQHWLLASIWTRSPLRACLLKKVKLIESRPFQSNCSSSTMSQVSHSTATSKHAH